MEKNHPGHKKAYYSLVLVFLLVTSLALTLKGKLQAAGMDTTILVAGNLLLFLIFLVSMFLNLRAVNHQSTHVFMRNVYSGMLLKLFGVAIAAFIYIYLEREWVNKAALFTCMFLYFVYTIIELRVVLKMTKTH